MSSPNAPEKAPNQSPPVAPPDVPLARWLVLIVMSLGIGAVGGVLFQWMAMPLAWMIGAMIFVTIAALSGAPMRGSSRLRNFMVPVLGIMLGSAFTPETLSQVHRWVPSILIMLVFVAIVIAGVATYLYRIMGFGPVSAYFSATPGGLTTMVVIGGAWGGDEKRIGLTHSIRVLLTVLIIPFYFKIFEGYVPGGLKSLGSIVDLTFKDGLILATCALGFPLFKILKLPAAQILGPMSLSAVVHAVGLTEAKPPIEMVNLAQLVIGTSIGARFAGVSVKRLFRVMIAAAVSTVFMVTLAAAAAWGLGEATGLPFHAIWLAFAPGGVAEMTLVSLSMGIDVAFVSTHHVIRVAFMVIAAPVVFHILRKHWDVKENPSQHGM